ncbi:MAG: hypothetical protein DMG22_10200 [Acidobacteria bacterium]|nr:MAG: hypothetical protein DMG22_10200 [Acidobacteriota bacterium]
MTVTAATPGTTADAIGLASTITGYAWAATTLGAAPGTAGSNGTTGVGSFGYWGGSAYSSTTAATNLASAIALTGNANVPVTATASASTVTVIADDPGTAQNSFVLSNSLGASMTGFNAMLSGGTAATQNGTNFAISAVTATEASNLATTINANTTLQLSTGVTASTGGTSTVTVTANTSGTAGNSIALVDNTLSNFTWTGQSGNPPTTTLAGGVNGQQNIVGFHNLYVNPSSTGWCTGNSPTVAWAYKTTSSPIATSPALSIDGAKVAYIESSSPPKLHVLKIGTTGTDNGTITVPATPGTNNNATDLTATFSSGTADLTSSPFPDYNTDSIYVCANDGKIHKFAGVFNGTPTEVVTGGWPFAVAASNVTLFDPILDVFSQKIFVTDGQHLFVVNLTAGVPSLGSNSITTLFGGAINGPPIVDPVNSKVYTFAGANGSNNAQVFQTDETITTVVTATLTNSKNGTNAYPGAFNNAYFTGSGTPQLYLCGSDSASKAAPALWHIGFSGTTMSTTATQAFTLSTGTPNCSPLTEIFNPNIGASPGTDFLFVGLDGSCGMGSASSSQGCVGAFNINSIPASAASASAVSESNGTSGIVVDNVANACTINGIPAPNGSCNAAASGGTGASSIFFSTLGNAGASPINCTTDGATSGGGCAVKLTQSALQ